MPGTSAVRCRGVPDIPWAQGRLALKQAIGPATGSNLAASVTHLQGLATPLNELTGRFRL